MRISTASIDAKLFVTGDGYYDFQHHHWDIMSSGVINTMIGNSPTYIWSVSGGGHNGVNGSWTIRPQSTTIPGDPTGGTGAKLRIDSSGRVTLFQTHPENNKVQADGMNNHPVQEMTWPTDLNWDPNHSVPSTFTWADNGAPTYTLTQTPVLVPPVQAGLRHPHREQKVLLLVESIALTPGAGPGGRGIGDPPAGATFWQFFQGCTGTEWWSWTINLIA